jgi:hypothetical protein
VKRLATILAIGLVIGTFEARAAEVFNDGEFTAWTFGPGSANTYIQRDPVGGNPGAKLTILTYNADPAAYGYKTDYATTAALEGTSFALTVDVFANWSQSVELIVEQAGTVYRLKVGDTAEQVAYATRVFNGTLSAAAFTKVAGAGPAQPNFAGGVATRFGIAGLSTFVGSVTSYYDNVRLNLGAVGGADPCAGFSDIAQDESFCQATIWLRNRGITSGCTATQFCPFQTVTRAQMALFMNRLGRALAPEALHKQAVTQNFVLPNANTPPGLLACATGDFATGDYARTARFTASYHAYPQALPVVSQGYWRYSTDAGVTWQYVGNWLVDQFPSAATANPPNAASATVLAPPLSLAPNTTYRFGLFLNGGNNDGIHGTLLSCQIHVDIVTPP